LLIAPCSLLIDYCLFVFAFNSGRRFLAGKRILDVDTFSVISSNFPHTLLACQYGILCLSFSSVSEQ